MSQPILHKYFDFGDRALANLTLASGERVLLTIVPGGFAVHRLHFFGIIPGRCVFGAAEHSITQMAAVLARDASQLPPLPRARGTHLIEPSARGQNQDGNLERAGRPLELFTRLAWSAHDEDDLVRLLERARNTPG